MSPTQVRIELMTTEDASDVGRLHRECIKTGFLSTLGPRFLRSLYAGLARSPHAFGFVAKRDSAVVGFIMCATDVSRVFRGLILKRFVQLALPLLRFLLRWRTVKRILETLFYPRRVSQDLPRPEVLSVAVDGECRGQGVGGMLMQACLERFRNLGIRCVKAAVGAENPGANSYFRKAGFELVTTMVLHGRTVTVYVANL